MWSNIWVAVESLKMFKMLPVVADSPGTPARELLINPLSQTFDMSPYHPTNASILLNMPNEVIGEIILSAIEIMDNVPTIDYRMAPLIFMHICRRLRQIAMNTPSLWRALEIDMLSVARGAGGDQVSLWLNRSGTLPLTLSVHLIPGISLNPRQESIFTDISAFCARWSNVSMTVDLAHLTALCRLQDADLPLLRNFDLKVYADQPHVPLDGPETFQRYNTFLWCGTLQRLGLGILPQLECALPIIWSNLTHLRLDKPPGDCPHRSMDWVAGVLREATRLVDLFIHMGNRDGQAVNYAGGMIVMASLLAFEVVDDSSCPFDILSIIDTPSLRRLTVKHKDFEDLGNPEGLCELLRRSPYVEEMTISHAYDLGLLKTQLQHCPSLKALYINTAGNQIWCMGADAFLEALVADDSGRICPQLEVLECCCETYASMDALLKLYTSNRYPRRGITRWKEVRIIGSSFDELVGVGEVQKLRTGGSAEWVRFVSMEHAQSV